MRIQTVETRNDFARNYYVGEEEYLSALDQTFDITNIVKTDNEVLVYVWHNGKETLFDRLPLNLVTHMEDFNHDPID